MQHYRSASQKAMLDINMTAPVPVIHKVPINPRLGKVVRDIAVSNARYNSGYNHQCDMSSSNQPNAGWFRTRCKDELYQADAGRQRTARRVDEGVVRASGV